MHSPAGVYCLLSTVYCMFQSTLPLVLGVPVVRSSLVAPSSVEPALLLTSTPPGGRDSPLVQAGNALVVRLSEEPLDWCFVGGFCRLLRVRPRPLWYCEAVFQSISATRPRESRDPFSPVACEGFIPAGYHTPPVRCICPFLLQHAASRGVRCVHVCIRRQGKLQSRNRYYLPKGNKK